MKYSIKKEAHPADVKADCVIVPVYDKGELSASAQELDQRSSGALAALMELGDFSGKKESVQVLYNTEGIEAKRVLLAGCGDREKFNLETLSSVMQAVAKQLKSMKIVKAASFLTETMPAEDLAKAVQQSIRAVAASFYSLDDFKSTKKEEDQPSLEEFVIAGYEDVQAGMQAVAIAEGIDFAKNMANQPGNVCTPSYLAEHAAQLAAEVDNLSLEVLEESDMEALGMGAFMSVSKGSAQDGKMIVLNYTGGNSGDKPVVLVGKGITFDTGGISLKPGAKMDEMKFDMGGAASVLGTMRAVSSMQLPMNVIGVIAAAENMPSGHASKPGDIVTSMSGKTIEVLNTDAEGRLVLCDALTFVKKYDPDVVIDIATLTGACIVALGHHICGLISNNDDLARDLMVAGEDALDQTWRLPYNEKYTKQLESEFADLGNIGGPAAGTITAGCFLAQFTEDYTWAHLDVAGTAWSGKAATGRPVPLLSQYLINRLHKA